MINKEPLIEDEIYERMLAQLEYQKEYDIKNLPQLEAMVKLYEENYKRLKKWLLGLKREKKDT